MGVAAPPSTAESSGPVTPPPAQVWRRHSPPVEDGKDGDHQDESDKAQADAQHGRQGQPCNKSTHTRYVHLHTLDLICIDWGLRVHRRLEINRFFSLTTQK